MPNRRRCDPAGAVSRRCGFREAVATLIGERHAPVKSKTFGLAGREPNSADDERSRRFALDLWRRARPPEATPVAVYLQRRDLLPPSPDVIRFHDAARLERMPAVARSTRQR